MINLKKVSQFPLLACCLLLSLQSFSQPSLGIHATLGEYAGDFGRGAGGHAQYAGRGWVLYDRAGGADPAVYRGAGEAGGYGGG